MRGFLWSVVREALLSRSEEAVKAAAELVAKYVPLTIEQIQAFLRACLDVAIRLGDEWVGTLVRNALAAAECTSGADGVEAVTCPPEVAEHSEAFYAMALAA